MNERGHIGNLLAAVMAAVMVAVLAASCDILEPPDYANETAGDAIKILTCNPITGTLSFMGPPLEHSMDMAAREINEAGGILGRKIRLIRADTHSDEDAAIAEAKFFYEKHPGVVGIAGASLDSVSKRLLLDIAKNIFDYGGRIPIISPASTSAEFVGLLDAQYNLFFRTVCSAHLEGRTLAEKARDMGHRIGAAIAFKDINNKEIFRTFREKFIEFGNDFQVKIFYYETPTVTEIKRALDEAYADEPLDFLLVLAHGHDGKVVLSEWARSPLKTPLLLSDSLMSDYFLASLDPKTLSELESGVVNGVFPGSSAGSKGLKVFAQRFCAQYPQHCRCREAEDTCATQEDLQPEIYTSNAYDAIYTMALGLALVGKEDLSAIDRGDSWDVDRISEGILRATNRDSAQDITVYPGEWEKALKTIRSGQEVNYEGSSSTSLELDEIGDPINCSFSFWSVMNGKVVFRNSDGEKESVSISL